MIDMFFIHPCGGTIPRTLALRGCLCAPGFPSYPGEIIGVNAQEELDGKLRAASKLSRLAVVYFTATWCGPCRYMSPLYMSLAGKYPKVVFLKVDIDEAKKVAAKWNISSVPTFIFIKKGNEVDKVIGADKNSLEKKIAEHANP